MNELAPLAASASSFVLFQVVALPLVLWLALRSAWRLWRRQRPRWVGIAGLVSWTAAALAIARPQWTNDLARALGIGRGADLVLYGVALAFLATCFYFYQKTRRLEADLTGVVRHLALREEREARERSRRRIDDEGSRD